MFRVAGLPARFSPMEYAQHHNTFTLQPVLKDVHRIQNLKDEFAILLSPFDRAAEPWMLHQHPRFLDYCSCDRSRKTRMAFLEEVCKSTEISHRSDRPVDLH
jgi:hypothetical protein